MKDSLFIHDCDDLVEALEVFQRARQGLRATTPKSRAHVIQTKGGRAYALWNTTAGYHIQQESRR